MDRRPLANSVIAPTYDLALWEAASVPAATERPRNDLRQYDDLADAWWDPLGPFAMLHWIAAARATLVPPARRRGAVLADLGCGAGLLAPHVAGRGYRHVGVDLTVSALRQAGDHGVAVARGDVARVPLGNDVAEVVCAGEILEHVSDHERVIAEMCRILAPGGTLVVDTIAATPLARLLAVEVPDRLPLNAPVGLHDPALFVDRRALVSACAKGGVDLRLRGLRPSAPALLSFWAGQRRSVPMVPTRPTTVLFQAWGTKRA